MSGRSRGSKLRTLSGSVLLVFLCAAGAFAQPGPPPPPPLPPVNAPPPNPITPQKALLGKILFWDEQLSSDDSVACGSCHMPEFGGSDPRSAMPESIHPGLDAALGTADDVTGSLGIVHQDAMGAFVNDPIFENRRQVTGRKTPSSISAAFSPLSFWDGRATGIFVDPETGAVVIPGGGALESQSLPPILSTAEMGHDNRTWDEVRARLQSVTPMALALELTPDIEQALVQFPDYPALFNNAFGTPTINARRIAFAIATYERTLIPNQTPYDQFAAGVPGALTPQQQQGFQVFVGNCLPCHGGGNFSDNAFHNVGVRPIAEDNGRQAITGNPADAGRFKTPTLRNVKLRAPYFHNGGKTTLTDVINFYNDGGEFFVNQDLLINPLGLSVQQRNNLRVFLEQALTDPRVEQGLPPFDHRTLRPYFRRGDANSDGAFNLGDVISMLDLLFQGGTPPACMDAVDANDDGVVDISDPIAGLARLFAMAPALPSPSDVTVGPDPTADSLECGP